MAQGTSFEVASRPFGEIWVPCCCHISRWLNLARMMQEEVHRMEGQVNKMLVDDKVTFCEASRSAHSISPLLLSAATAVAYQLICCAEQMVLHTFEARELLLSRKKSF
eukprot:2966706-Pleurochrysis_carterae.AAC.1